MLTYCWSILNSLPKTAKEERKQTAATTPTASGDNRENPYQVLMEEEDVEEEDIVGEEEENMFPSKPMERPASPSGTKQLSLDELVNSDVHNDVFCSFYRMTKS